MPSPAEGIAWYLNSKGIGSTTPGATTWPIKIGRLVETPDAMIALFDTGGFSPNTKWLLDFPTVQALVRSGKDSYQSGYAKALEIKDVLLGVEPQDVGSTGQQVHWSGITMLSDLTFLKYDDNSRALFTVNFRLLVERPTNALTNRDPLDYYGP